MKIKKLLFSALLFSISFSGFGADAGSEALAIAERASVYIDKASFSVEKDETATCLTIIRNTILQPVQCTGSV